MKKRKCQCNKTGKAYLEMKSLYDQEKEWPFVAHLHFPNKCKCTNNIKPYNKDGKIVYLCSCCC